MRTALRIGLMLCAALLLAASPAGAQDKAKVKKKAPKPEPAEVAAPADPGAAEAAVEPGPAAPEVSSEATVELCLDKTDNDADGFIDCADQDCDIFAVCVRPVVVPAPAPVPEPPAPPPPPVFIPKEERGRMCWDGIDNDRDGLADCFEKSCHATRYCEREIYYQPKDPKKAPGFMVSFGGGIATPNFRGNDTTTNSVYGKAKFEPDIGALAHLSLGVLPVTWFGVGLQLMGGGSYASNRPDWSVDDPRDDPNKYDAYKGFLHVGGFLRFQMPFDRIVPYLEIAGGYSYARERWSVYSDLDTWEDIDQQDSTQLHGDPDEPREVYRHFTLGITPGFDVFVSDRRFAVGLRAWMPVWATSHPSVDNIGVMLNFTITPLWREKRVLRPEYANPAATLEEETGTPAPAATPAPPEPPAAAPTAL
jgi:hypothetical protein